MYGRVEIFPDKSVMLHIPKVCFINNVLGTSDFKILLDEVLLCDVTSGEIPDAVHGHDADVLNSSQ